MKNLKSVSYRELLRTSDAQSALFFIFFGVLTMVLSRNYEFGTPSEMGPGFFPTILGFLLIVVGIVVGVQAFRTNIVEELEEIPWRPIIFITLAVLVSAMLLLNAGIAVAIPSLVFISALSSRIFNLSTTIITSIVLILFAGGIFVWGLDLRIPMWWG